MNSMARSSRGKDIRLFNMSQRKVERPSKEHLLREIESSNYCAVGREYGVSDNTIRKWLKSEEI